MNGSLFNFFAFLFIFAGKFKSFCSALVLYGRKSEKLLQEIEPFLDSSYWHLLHSVRTGHEVQCDTSGQKNDEILRSEHSAHLDNPLNKSG